MPTLIHGNTTQLWHLLVEEGLRVTHQTLPPALENYLVELLSRFCTHPELAKSVLGLEFLESFQYTSPAAQSIALQAVGDKCLLFTGLFPEYAYKRRVDIRYYVDLGQQAYGLLKSLSWEQNAMFFQSLCEAFVPLMDVLNALRHDTALDLSQNLLLASEIAEKAGGNYAKTCLQVHHISLKNYMVQ